jgi:phospholipid transport system substrate-binding protein
MTLESGGEGTWLGLTRKRLRELTLRLAVAAWLGMGIATAAQDSPAANVVERFQRVLLSVMSDGQKLGYSGRQQQLAPAVQETHDLAAIAQFALGRYWDRLDAAQRKLFIDTFGELSIATYASRFDSYAGENFKTVSVERLENGDALVRSLFTQPKGDTLRFDFVLREREGSWRIINIVVDGVSDLAIKRAEYAAILRDEGFDALIAKLKQKIAQSSGTAPK